MTRGRLAAKGGGGRMMFPMAAPERPRVVGIDSLGLAP